RPAGRARNALGYLPRKPTDSPTKWLKALALRAAEQPKAARALFEQLAVEGGPLSDRALHLAALCAIDEGKASAAERLLGQVSLRYVDADEALLERARQTIDLRVAGPRTAARVEEILQPIFAGMLRADVAAAHLIAGDVQFAAGAKEKARTHWRAAWVEHPLSTAADSARERERQLGPGRSIAPLLLVRRAEMLLDAHRNREALDQLGRIPVASLCHGGCPGDRRPALGGPGAQVPAVHPRRRRRLQPGRRRPPRRRRREGTRPAARPRRSLPWQRFAERRALPALLVALERGKTARRTGLARSARRQPGVRRLRGGAGPLLARACAARGPGRGERAGPERGGGRR